MCLDQCVCAVWCSWVNCTGTEGTGEGNIVETGVMCAVWCSGVNCTGAEGTDDGNIIETGVMCAVWCSRVNCTGAEGTVDGNIIETGVMSQVERVGLVLPGSVCLCGQSGGCAGILLFT